jgi:hypothetical protein
MASRSARAKPCAPATGFKGPHPVECLDAVDQPLGIIQPVDADRELLTVQASPQPGDVRMGRGLGGELGELLGIDADREYRGAGSAMARIDDAATHGEPEILLRIRQKILAILLGLETDQIISQHRSISSR